jgi:PAS domain S-box-containing protein
MQITRLRDKLLLRAITIGMVVALASMLAASVVIRQQNLDQSTILLRKASNVINDNLEDRKEDLLTASRQLATQKNLGSTIWYLTQYAQSDIDHEALFNAYQQLAKDTYKIGRVAKLSKISIYDSAGHLVSFALFDSSSEQIGFVERFHAPSFRIATLKDGEDLTRHTLRVTDSVAKMQFEFGGQLPQQESVHYAVVNGLLAIESHVPIMGEAFDPTTGKQEIKQLGLVAMVQPLDQAFVDHLTRLTEIKINVFTRQGFNTGNVTDYRNPDWSNVPVMSDAPTPSITFNEITINGAGFYQNLIPLYSDKHLVGAIAALYSKEIAQKSTWEIIRILGLIAASSLVFIFPFSWYFATSISHPLIVLSRIFRDVASGKQAGLLSNELGQLEKEKVRHDELGDLTQSFIAMNDAVNQKIQQINEINASLEKKIGERTAALVASEQASRTLIENFPDSIVRYDRNCRRIYVNPAFGASTDGGVAALLGRKPSEYPGGSNAEIYETKVKEVFATGNNSQFELKWLDKDGKEICSHIRLAAERNLSGAITSVLGVGRDITELNESRIELNRKELAKTRFLAAAGHDLRQPLAAANLFIDALKFTQTTSDQNQIIQRLDQTMATFNGLLEALLNISKLDAGIIKPEYTSINVIEIINWLEQSFAPLAREKQLGFKLYFPMKERLVIRSDIGLIKSVLMNLVSNAIKYTSNGAILISARRRGGDVLFQVWDTGMGIKAEHLEHIFEEFYQIDNPQRDRTSGLGLGLAISKRAISLLGSEITCHSRIGHGSVFGFILPVDTTPSGITPQDAQVHLPEDVVNDLFARGKRFIVVEDDALVAQAMVISLQGMGAEVKYFHSAEDALRYAHVEHADYYIVDHMLGGTFNGIQFLNQLRQELGRPIIAVLMTGDTSPSFIREAVGFDWPVLHKPTNLSKLISSLSTQTLNASISN